MRSLSPVAELPCTFRVGGNVMIDAQFQTGQIVGTPKALAVIESAGQSALDFLKRHASCDWGDVCDQDKALNDQAIDEGDRLLSAYKTNGGVDIWIITESDRSVTTILLPSEY